MSRHGRLYSFPGTHIFYKIGERLLRAKLKQRESLRATPVAQMFAHVAQSRAVNTTDDVIVHA